MKKILLFLFAAVSIFSFSIKAQTITCNAGFSFVVTGSTVQFTPVANADSAITSHYWNFGDGSALNTTPSPNHTYTNPGTYNVKQLIIKHNPNGIITCTDSVTKPVSITACNLAANFYFYTDSVNSLKTHFINTTNLLPTDTLYWSFGDGSTSFDINPIHTYANAGVYSVCLHIKRNNAPPLTPCTSEKCLTDTVSICNLTANFYKTATATNYLSQTFYQTTSPITSTDSVRWTFGDGSTLSGLQSNTTIANPTHTYAQPGIYTVCLRVKKNSNTSGTASCVSEICHADTISYTCTPPIVYFTKTINTSNPLIHHYTQVVNQTNATDSLFWFFGDGTSVVGLQGNASISSLNHTFASAGVYNVCLKIKRNNTPAGVAPCINYYCVLDTVVSPNSCTLVANYSFTGSTSNPLSVAFTNLSTPLATSDSITWTFGDGTSSSSVSPTHIYTLGGTYNVCLRVKKNTNPAGATPCVSEICKTITVTVPCTLVSNFSFAASTSNPLSIAFTNLSTPLSSTDSIRWTFGDSTTSLSVSPTHVYAHAGTYNVCLRVKKVTGPGAAPCVSEICKTVIVTDPCNFQVAFTKQHDSINSSKVNFTNLTISPVASATAKWSFGDSTFATTWNATHTYSHPGTFTVCLSVQTTTNCIKQYCDTVVIPVPIPSCSDISKFTYLVSPTDKQTYTFTASNIATNIIYTWTFGDYFGSHDPITTHRYAQSGTYTACLTSWRSATCASTTCAALTVLPQINCDSLHVSYVAQNDPVVLNKYYFYANANATILDQTWTITKASPSTTPPVILHQNDPVYIFTDTGYYYVCLKAITSGGCVKDYCSTIHVQHIVTNACELQAYPNPASNVINVAVILTQAGTINATIYNSSNVAVKQVTVQGISGNNIVSININDLVAGAYIIRFTYEGKVCYARFNKL